MKKLFAIPRRSVVFLTIGLASILASSCAMGQVDGNSSAPSGGGSLPSPAQVKACLTPPGSAECLDKLFREMLKTHSTAEALELVQRFEREDPELRRHCHPVVHAIGRETYRLKGTVHDSFSACDQTCHSGCYHG
ncbi:MAG: hypothetical protein OEN50_18305, partial [Deltaproteobacteria bacterium]|nr:hypothetical protein [Deltaproteobacteria bacterium]